MMIASPEAEHHRMGHHADQFAQAKQAEQGHEYAAEHHRGQKVRHPVLRDERHDHHGHRAGGTRKHAGPAAEYGRHQADDERAIQAQQRIDLRHQRKGYAFRHQRERRCQAGEEIFLYIRAPFFSKRILDH
jgi:hypothetical protein